MYCRELCMYNAFAKDVRHLKLEFSSEAGLVYEPGDVCQLQLFNPPEVVQRFLIVLGLQADTWLDIKTVEGEGNM